MTVGAGVSWVKVDERIYVDVMAFEALLRDFIGQLLDENDPDGAEAIGRVVEILGSIAGRHVRAVSV